MVKFQIFNFFLLWVVVYILYLENSMLKLFCFLLIAIFGKHEVTSFCWFWQYLLFLCSDCHQKFYFISFGGILWMNFHFYKMALLNQCMKFKFFFGQNHSFTEKSRYCQNHENGVTSCFPKMVIYWKKNIFCIQSSKYMT